jgi:hydroxyethylthiazole kinase-like uncharacterized protein yjeF
MAGALLLAARTALFAGAGRVFASFLDPQMPTLDTAFPELMLRSPEWLEQALDDGPLTALAIGPGLGMSQEAQQWLETSLRSPLPLVIDADGLNLLATDPSWASKLVQRRAPTLLTPHPAEAARLLGCTVEAVQAQRMASCQRLYEACGVPVVLKGRRSVLMWSDEMGHIQQYLNPTGNPGLAAAGMGDVLTGLACSFLAQGKPAHQALAAAVYVHGLAADQLVQAGIGPIGLRASELAQQIRQTLNAWVHPVMPMNQTP